MHRDTAKRILIGCGALVVGAAIARVGIIVQGGGALPFKSYTTLTAAFSDVGTLKAQQTVTEDGVRIGVVTGVAYRAGAAHVTMRLDGHIPIYRNATAKIGNVSALGRKYIALTPGTATSGLLGNAELPEKQTVGSIDLGNVLEAFPPSARAGLSTTLNNVGSGLGGHSDDLYDGVQAAPKLLDDAQTILQAANSQEANLPALLGSADRIVQQLNGHEAQLNALIANAGATFGALNTGNSRPLRDAIAQAPDTLRTATAGLRAINPALSRTADAVKRLSPGIGDLVDATPDLRGFLTESPPVAVTVVRFAHDSVPAVKALVPAVTDLQPTIAHLGEALSYTDPILAILGPFAPDAGHLFANNNLLSGNYGPTKHYFSAELVFPGLYNLSLPDPTVKVRPYEGPGGAFSDSADARRAAER
jgi:phospholipid/cholesterol/gamma-HCH transport system substrate-binding protein